MKIKLQLSKEHLKRSSRKKPLDALNEIIWNSLDADANNVYISTSSKAVNNTDLFIDEVKIQDDGVGLNYKNVSAAIECYGNSPKSGLPSSISGRPLHGKLGEGRYSSFSIGNYVLWHSNFLEDEEIKGFDITFRNGDLDVDVNDPISEDNNSTGLSVTISNLTDEAKNIFCDNEKIKSSILKEFCAYLVPFPSINIFLNSSKLNFDDEIAVIKNYERTINKKVFRFKFIKWKNIKSKEIYICGNGEVVYLKEESEILNNDISLFISSEYFDSLKVEEKIDLLVLDNPELDLKALIKKLNTKFIQENEILNNNEIIEKMKVDNVYPYLDEPTTLESVEHKRIFDVLAINLHEIAPHINTANKDTRKLAYKLINEAIKTNPSSLKKILTEVFKLSDAEKDKFAKLLDDVSLSAMIAMTDEVNDRLNTIDLLQNIVYSDKSKYIKERIQFQPFLLNKLWIFGDQYKFATEDTNIRNVLKTFRAELKDFQFELTDDDLKNEDFNKIPDIVLFNRACFNKRYENLVIELKKPSKIIGPEELEQIKKYAYTITSDSRFNGEKNTFWKFILVGQDIEDYVKKQILNIDTGVVQSGDNFSIVVTSWSSIIEENRLRYEFYKQNLEHNLSENKLKDLVAKEWDEKFGNKIRK